MASSDKELAFFGGWTRRVLAGGDVAWGSPMHRVQEVVPSVPSGLRLPPDSDWLPSGVPFWIVNTGVAALTVKRPSDGTTVVVVGSGVVAMCIYGAGWFGTAVSAAAQFGAVHPALRYTLGISANAANVNMLELAIARGYDGLQPAAVTCRVRSGVAVGTVSQSLRAITTGNTIGGISWAPGSFALLVIESGGASGGWGGPGGRGGVSGTGASAGFAGEAGGQAIRAEIPLRIDCQGAIVGGGGGGGGGGSSSTIITIVGGGGGGGRGMNMAPGGTLIGSLGGGATAPGQVGPAGGAFSHGSLVNGTGGLGANTGGNGGRGGAGGLAGQPGTAGPGTGGTAGAGGAAISYLPAAGAPTILAGTLNILGTTVSEAS